jgi:hypothetical protein
LSILRKIDNTEAADSNLLYNAISADLQPVWQCGVVLTTIDLFAQ